MKRSWFRLDNAALIFPAVLGRKWSNAFRLSATLTEEIDRETLTQAAEDLRTHFPTFFVRLRTGFFWYYLEEIPSSGCVRPEYAYPLTYMSRRELRESCIRILYFQNRVAVEFFHSVTDGTGGLRFLKNLVARYLELKYGLSAESTDGLDDLRLPPEEREVCDCFPLHSAEYASSRRESDAYRMRGTAEKDGFRHLITGILPAEVLLQKAHEYHTTVTAFLASVLAESVYRMQNETLPEKHQRPVKITVPVNLRRLYGEKTLRNFVLTVNAGFDPRMGSYTLEEICAQISHQIAAEAVPQKMAGRIAANVKPQKNPVIRLMPLAVKNLVMRGVYADSGEKKGCMNLSNLGQTEMPPVFAAYIRRLEFIIGVQRSYPNNCSVVSFGGKTYINMIRSIRETEVERLFFSRLVELGIPVEIEENERER